MLVRDLDADERAARPELAAQNVARFRSLVPLLIAGHVVAMGTAVRWVSFGDYQSVAFVVHGVTMALALALLAVAMRGADRPAPAWFGDAAVLLYSGFGLVISINAQSVTTSADFLNFAMFSTSVLFRARFATVVAAYLGGAGVFWVMLEFMQPVAEARTVIATTSIAVAILALGFSRLLVRSELRAIADRHIIGEQQRELETHKLQLETSKAELEASKEDLEARQGELQRLNETLEKKVEGQLEELLQRSQEVEALDAQLRVKVRDRAKELVRALRQRPAQPDAPLATGSLFAGRLVIRRKLGEGGMGEVYLAEDKATKRLVALKRLRSSGPTDASTLARFASEAAASAAVDHPGVVRCMHVDVSDDGGIYHIMEYVKGCTLQSALGSAAAEMSAALRIGAGIADVLAAAHAAGVVHRDVKPANIMLTDSAPGLRVMDFGISKVRDEPTDATRTGQVLGTPRYMAPEQLTDGAAISGATDVYALGAVIFEMIAGRPPFVAKSLHALLHAHLEKPVPNLAEHAMSVPPDVAELVTRCLAKDPNERPPAIELAHVLDTIADGLGADSLDELGGRLAAAGRARAFFDFDGVAQELAHAIARPSRKALSQFPTKGMEIAAAAELEPPPSDAGATRPVQRPPKPTAPVINRAEPVIPPPPPRPRAR
jgi:tRNA A-37 threonylcarbamoyl transferase component Bud32